MDYILKTVDISPITLGRALTIVGSSLGLAVALMLVYMFTHRRTGWRPSIAMTMLMLGPIVSIIVLCIGSNIARAISIGGGLALVRFRNTVEDPRDLIYFFPRWHPVWLAASGSSASAHWRSELSCSCLSSCR